MFGSDVGYFVMIFVVIDIMFVVLFWSWGLDEDIVVCFVKKMFFVGVFVYLIGNWNSLVCIVFESFVGFGLKVLGVSFFVLDFFWLGKIV